MTAKTRISVIGLGRLGAPVAACLGMRGFPVIGYDPLPEKVEALLDRRSLNHEPGVNEALIAAGDALRATGDLREAVRESDVSLVAVPTPSAADGAIGLEYVLPTCAAIGEALREHEGYHVVSIVSTLMPGAAQRQVRQVLEETSGRKAGEGWGLCYTPLFVTMGNVVREFLNPEFALIGEWDARSGQVMEGVWRRIVQNGAAIVRMGLANAELTKLAVNVFVTTKISFANMLARLCEQMPGGNVDVVTAAMQLDERIGRGSLCGAIAYGGPFFDHDNLALGAMMRRLAVAPELAGVLGRFNRAQVPWLADVVHERVRVGDCVAVLGLSYKPDTDVTLNSVGIELCERLDSRGLDVVAHDPVAMPEARGALPRAVDLAPTLEGAIARSDVVVIATPWEQYRHVAPTEWARTDGAARVVVDCWRIAPQLRHQEGVVYVPLGVGPGAEPTEDLHVRRPDPPCA